MTEAQTDSPRLEELYLADQADREQVFTSQEGMRELKHRDAMRRTLVGEMIARGEINTPNDLYHAAVLFLHGGEPKDFLVAHRFATIAAINGHKPARWLVAATLDRFLISSGAAQIYGTQFEHEPETNQYRLRLPMDDAHVLGFEKGFFNVPPVSERLAQLNGRIQTN